MPEASKPAETAKETPRMRRYKMRANAECGPNADVGPGAFNGVCIVYEGDEFYLNIPTIKVKVRDADGKVVLDARGAVKTIEMDGKIPSWCTPLAEYPLDSTPQPLRVMQPA